MKQVEALLPSDFSKTDWIPDPNGKAPPQGDDGVPREHATVGRAAYGYLLGSDEYYTRIIQDHLNLWEGIADGVIDMGLLKAKLLATVIALLKADKKATEEIHRLRKEIEAL